MRELAIHSRIGLGCMRLSTDVAPELARATIAAALDAGITLFDTARAYTSVEGELGHNERLLAGVLRTHPSGTNVRVITKCGMRRDGGLWIPDGRAKQIAEDVTASIEALESIPIDFLLLHAPDPRVSLTTTARALARVVEDGLARHVGVSNVSRKQLEEIAANVPIAAVEVALGAYDDMPIRNGVVAYCIDRGIPILAHAPLGGPERASRFAHDTYIAPIAARLGVSGADVFLAYLLAVHPEIVPIVGARSPQTITLIRSAAQLPLEDEDLRMLDARFPALGNVRRPPPAAALRDAEIVMIMGVAGAGKSRAAQAYVERGYERLNRDTVGGTLRAIADHLDERLASDANRFVLDNTYVTRASRTDVLDTAARHGARVRCIFLDTPLAEAQVNVVLRMLERFGRIPNPDEIAALARSEPAALAPHALSRMTRQLEPPSADEGFCEITSVPFVREPSSGRHAGVFVPLAALNELDRILDDAPPHAPCLVFGWKPDGNETSLPRSINRAIEIGICPHPAGPPICWCRPPLPGLILSFAHSHDINLRASMIYASSPTHRTIARVLGMKVIDRGI